MGLYDAQRNPFHQRINSWSNARTNDHLQRMAKSIPCHVTKVDKDFVEVQFDTQGGGLTPPTVKMPQSFSAYSREPTQVGDRGYAVPSDYTLGGNSGWGQGTSYYPRGNLAPLSFQPIAHTSNPKRDYDQHTIVGGPNGILMVQANPPQPAQPQTTQAQGAGGGSGGGNGGWAPGPNMRRMRVTRAVPGVGLYIAVPAPRSARGAAPGVSPYDVSSTGSSGAGSGSAGAPASTALPAVPDPQTTLDTTNHASLMIDQNQKHTLDGTQGHKLTIDQQHNKITVEVKPDGSHFIWVGGDGTEPQKYAPLATTRGPVINAMGRIIP